MARAILGKSVHEASAVGVSRRGPRLRIRQLGSVGDEMRATSRRGYRRANRFGNGMMLTGLWLGLIGAEALTLMVWWIG